MKTIIKGTTVTVRWAFIRTNGTPFPLANYDYELSYYTGRGRSKIEGTATIGGSGNVLIWTFTGNQQTFDGVYGVNLHLYLNHVHVATFDQKDAFELRRYAPGALDVPVTIELFTTYDGGNDDIRLFAEQALAKSLVIEPLLDFGTPIAYITKNDGTVIQLLAPTGGGSGSVSGISINGVTYGTPDKFGIINISAPLLENPAGGEVGYYLKKTDGGVEWAPVSAVGAGQNLVIAGKTYNGSVPVTVSKNDLINHLAGEYLPLRTNGSLLASSWKLNGIDGEGLLSYNKDSAFAIGDGSLPILINGTQIRLNPSVGGIYNGIYLDGLKFPKPSVNGTFLKYNGSTLEWSAEMADTWRHISVNGDPVLGNTPSAGEGLNFIAGENIQLAFSNGDLVISATGGGGGGGTTVAWGTESGGTVPLSVGGASKTLSLSTHTHDGYAQTSDLNDYLPLTGGTLTGDVNTKSLMPNGHAHIGDFRHPYDSIYAEFLGGDYIMCHEALYLIGLDSEEQEQQVLAIVFDNQTPSITFGAEAFADTPMNTFIKGGSALELSTNSDGYVGFYIGDPDSPLLTISADSIVAGCSLDMGGFDIVNVNGIQSMDEIDADVYHALGGYYFEYDGDVPACLKYDADSNAIYVVGPDGEAVNFYATGEITAGGINGNGLAARVAALEAALAEIPEFEYDSENHVLSMTHR